MSKYSIKTIITEHESHGLDSILFNVEAEREERIAKLRTDLIVLLTEAIADINALTNIKTEVLREKESLRHN